MHCPPTSAATRRAAAPLLLGAGRSMCPAREALSSKPAARRCGVDRRDRQTDDGRLTVT